MDAEALRILFTVLAALGASLGVRWLIVHWLAREEPEGDDWMA